MVQNRRKTAIVTGSTKGIGKAIALRLVQEGYTIVLNYASDTATAQETLRFFQRITPYVLLIRADVSNKHDVEMLLQESVQSFGSVDVLINNAAKVIDTSVLEMSEDDWDRVIDTNLKGAFLCSQIAASYMLQQDQGGTILNIGASTGIRGRKNGANTCASKAGIMLLTQCLALELGPKIRVNTIVPGLTHTEETERRFHLNDPLVLQARQETIPLGRIGMPEDIANAVVLLLSHDAHFINGQKIIVDGGQYMW